MTPPAYGTQGNATRGLFVGPKYQDVDIALEKMWHVKERYTVQLRIQCYNVFNEVSFLPSSDGSSYEVLVVALSRAATHSGSP